MGCGDRCHSGEWGNGEMQGADLQLLSPYFAVLKMLDQTTRCSYYTTNPHRNNLSKGLDELSLYHMQSQQGSVTTSAARMGDDRESSMPTHKPQIRPQPVQLSRQEIIAAQRAALRAKQGAILSAQVNSEQGIDILLPDKATLRSTRLAADEAIQYSYIEPDGEMYDITDIMDDER